MAYPNQPPGPGGPNIAGFLGNQTTASPGGMTPQPTMPGMMPGGGGPPGGGPQAAPPAPMGPPAQAGPQSEPYNLDADPLGILKQVGQGPQLAQALLQMGFTSVVTGGQVMPIPQV